MSTPGDDRKTATRKEYIFPEKRASRTATFSGALGRASVVGLHPLSGILVGGGSGYFLWKHFDAQWIFWILLLMGFVAGCRNAYREMRSYLREQDETETNEFGAESENAAKKP